ncbi:hypothetical protein [Patiriisocius sp. Uisw_017]|uniref:hypothetical protein n=1 Tax=Patiriisocius sp. Uisw_017 TaxID=3230968 RepID=UPI0039E8EDAD
MQKFFNVVIIIFSIILSLFSLIAFVFVHLELSKRNLQLDLEGINNYFAEITNFKELFGATITLILAYYGLKRLKTAEKSNRDKVKTDRFSDWKSITELRMNEVREKNKIFVREFSRLRYNLFNDIYDKKMSIKSKKELDIIYDKHFNDITRAFEESNDDYVGMGGIYRTADSTYFFDDFYFVFIGCLDSAYDGMYNDIKNRYLLTLDANRLIGIELHNGAYTRHTGIV